MMETWQLAVTVGVGIVAGAVNTIAGGGSLMAVPALIFLGLPATIANATNRVGVLFQSVAASIHFKRADKLDVRGTLPLFFPTCVGAIIGALLSVDIDDALLEKIIGVAMVVMLSGITFAPKLLLEAGNGKGLRHIWRGWRYLGFFVVGLYGGFLQAGVGVFLLLTLVVFNGQDLIRANASKVLLIGLFTAPAMAIYIHNDLIRWAPGLGLAVGSVIGAWLGAKMTMSWGPRFVRWVLIFVISVSSTRLLGVW